MKRLLAIVLSILAVSCADDMGLPEKPPGWHCTYFFDESGAKTGFYCNGMRQPESKQFFQVDHPEIQKAQCMPLRSYERYQAYVQKLKEEARKRCL